MASGAPRPEAPIITEVPPNEHVPYAILGFYCFFLLTLVMMLYFISPRSRGPLGYMRRLVYEDVPANTESIIATIFGDRTVFRLRAVGRSVKNRAARFVQAFYILLMGAGFYLYTIEVFDRLPNAFLSDVHLYTGTVCVCICFTFFLLGCICDPGVVDKLNEREFVDEYEYDHILYYPERECTTCKTIRPARSKHCSSTNQCVARFDHYCVWLDNAIGKYNYRYFMSFLLSHSILTLYGTIVGYYTVQGVIESESLWTELYYYRGGTHRPTTWIIFTFMVREYTELLFLTALCGALFIIVFAYFCFHLRSISGRGVTSNEVWKRDAIHAHLVTRQKLLIKYFFAQRRLREEKLKEEKKEREDTNEEKDVDGIDDAEIEKIAQEDRGRWYTMKEKYLFGEIAFNSLTEGQLQEALSVCRLELKLLKSNLYDKGFFANILESFGY